MRDPRAGFADYYDLEPDPLEDIPFYLRLLPSGEAAVLELGCGTGRVSVDLARSSRRFVGIDHSTDMAARCRDRLLEAGIDEARAEVRVADITDFSLDERFDFIVAPYRVMQNLETDAQVDGLFACIRAHLADGGRCILNTFRPLGTPEELLEKWRTPEESERWTVQTDEGRVVHLDRRTGVKSHPLTLYPELVYRRYRGGELVDEAVLSIAMRCYYPDELLARVRGAGFRVERTWGGYAGEAYGEGPEQVVEFML